MVSEISVVFPYILFILVVFYNENRIKIGTDKDFSYTALGDDLSNGIITRVLRGFTFRLNTYFKGEHPKVIYNNFAKPGFTSSNLLFQLENDSDIRRCIKNSKLVTMSIGLNNLLDFSEENYNEIDGQVAKVGVEDFREDWPKLLEYIRHNIDSKAKIYMMTVFNPYDEEDLNYTIAEYYVSRLNAIIQSEFWIKTYDYEVVDVHDLFSLSRNHKLTLYNSIVRRPIPSRKGFKEIAEAFIEEIKNY
jgi:hypothetical protein